LTALDLSRLPGTVKRAPAKSMALIEATGDYFTEVKARLAVAAAPGEKVAAELDRLYTELIGDPQPSALNSMIVDRYKAQTKEGFEPDIAAFYSAKPWLPKLIAERATSQALYRQPAVLLVYWVIAQTPSNAAKESPLTEAVLATMCIQTWERAVRQHKTCSKANPAPARSCQRDPARMWRRGTSTIASD
jgi:putative GTP pyrophosphokinase